MSDNSKFTVTVNGESVSILLEKARALCPDEVRAMEAAGEKVSKAAKSGDSQEAAVATQELQQRMEALLRALAETALQQQEALQDK